MSRGRRGGGGKSPAQNGNGTADDPVGYVFDLTEEICRTNRKFPIVTVGDTVVEIRLLPAAMAEEWLSTKAQPADDVEVDQQTWYKRQRAATEKAQALTLDASPDDLAAADAAVDLARGKVAELKGRRVKMVAAAVGAYCEELAAVVDRLSVPQLYEVFIRLVKYSDPLLVGGQLQVQHMLGTSSARAAFQQSLGKTPSSSQSGRK